MDIIKILKQRASELQDELGKIHEAIRAMTGTKIARNTGKRKFRHTAATKRKLRLAIAENLGCEAQEVTPDHAAYPLTDRSNRECALTALEDKLWTLY